jgi:hypothetical protein
VDNILGLPEHPSPPGIKTKELKNDLLKHQVLEKSSLVALLTEATEASTAMGFREGESQAAHVREGQAGPVLAVQEERCSGTPQLKIAWTNLDTNTVVLPQQSVHSPTTSDCC